MRLTSMLSRSWASNDELQLDSDRAMDELLEQVPGWALNPGYGDGFAMHSIRPYKLFTLLDPSDSDRTGHVAIPARRAAGSLMLLETFALITAARIVAARRVFEIGTFHGATTLNLALNIPEDGRIYTLDLDARAAGGLSQLPDDARLTEEHLAVSEKLDFHGTPVARKIKTLTANSLQFDFSPWKESIDLAFIDGGHDVNTASSDTQNALMMISRTRPSCVLWHDYHNPKYPELTRYLDELGGQIDLFHIEDTMLCLYFNDPSGEIRAHLLS
jgi:hypothetical protein